MADTDAIVLQHRRGTSAEVDAFTGAEGEITYSTDTHELRTHDGVTAGGYKLARDSEVVKSISGVKPDSSGNVPNIARTNAVNAFTATQTFKSEIVLANGGRILDWTAGGLYKEVCIKTDSDGNGTVLGLRAADSPKEPSTFLLRAGGADNAPALYGKPDGTLEWNGRAVTTIVDTYFDEGGLDTVRFSNGMQFVMGLQLFYGYQNRKNFPRPFKAGTYISASAVDVGGGTVDMGVNAQATYFDFYVRSSNGGTQDSCAASLIFIGWWK